MAMNNDRSSPGVAIVVFGVSGCGKTTIGRLLAEELRCDFLDADDFHTKNNIDKMRSGIALSDSDRLPWLEKLRDTLASYLIQNNKVVLACSALKNSYRDVLRGAAGAEFDPKNNNPKNKTKIKNNKVVFVYLKVSDSISARIEARFNRGGHYMPPSLLESQLATLEDDPETDVVAVETGGEARVVAADAINKLRSMLKFPCPKRD